MLVGGPQSPLYFIHLYCENYGHMFGDTIFIGQNLTFKKNESIPPDGSILPVTYIHKAFILAAE